jgi:hypothetical protein
VGRFCAAGQAANIWQVIGFFKTGWSTEFVQVFTGRSFRKGRLPGEWESRVPDGERIDLVNPLYCRGVLEAIEAMHVAADWSQCLMGDLSFIISANDGRRARQSPEAHEHNEG